MITVINEPETKGITLFNIFSFAFSTEIDERASVIVFAFGIKNYYISLSFQKVNHNITEVVFPDDYAKS